METTVAFPPHSCTAGTDGAGVAAGLQTRDRTAAELGVSERTVIRWEQSEGLPVIAVGKLRLHDPAAVREWLRGRGMKKRPEPVRRGRPRKHAA